MCPAKLIHLTIVPLLFLFSGFKIAFNNVFGYYLEVRNTHKDKVPEDWMRKQTLVNAERYITEELKIYDLDEDGRIYVADRGNGRVQRFEPTGTFDLLFGQTVEGLDGLESPTRLATWLGIASRGGVTVSFPGARVYVVDRALAQIRIFEDARLTEFQDDA